jgi:glycosyltransferase involved in cell wall biosynthesis
MTHGLNLIGDLYHANSLSEVARITLNAIRAVGMPFSYIELLYPYAEHGFSDMRTPDDPRYRNLPTGSQFSFNLVCYNIGVYQTIKDNALSKLLRGKYTAAKWVWEMSTVPQEWLLQFARLNEVWVPSQFTQASFAAVTSTPIQVVGHPINLEVSATRSRQSFGLPEDRYMFLFSFNATAGDGRKNPWGVIKAYQRAFGTSTDGPLLVIKCQYGHYYPDFLDALHKAVDAVGGILLTDNLSRQQMNDLLACTDAYISLHRAEGFGLGIAEAMYLGKPVIATHYSGNVDFMTHENSFPVDYNLRAVLPEDHRYTPHLADVFTADMMWAEPDLQQAADSMTRLVENPDLGHSLGQRAAQDIRENYSYQAIGRQIFERVKAVTA